MGLVNKTFGLSILAACAAAGVALAQENPPQYVPGALIVRSKADAPAALVSKVLLSHGVRSRRDIGRSRMTVLDVPPSAEAVIQKSLAASGLFEYVERDAYARAGAVPNDPSYVSQWHLPKVKAPEVWEWQKGSPALVIAVIDAGIDTTHPEFAGKLVSGWNFVSGSATIVDNTGHGTAVAGVIAAATDNALGIAGANWESKLMPLVVLDSNNYASYSNIAKAIYWAADRGVRIINISIGGTSASSTLQNAVDYAWTKGAVVFAAAMNSANSTKYYPAACNRVLAISATDQNDYKASFSSFGSWISLSAPGVSILTTARGGGYGYWSGTSFASPLAAGVASLVLSAQPSATAAELVNALQSGADDIGEPGKDDYFGYGRVNVERAAAAFMPPPPVSVAMTPQSVGLSASGTQQFSATVAGTANTAVNWNISPALGTISPRGFTPRRRRWRLQLL
jgi:thermitase